MVVQVFFFFIFFFWSQSYSNKCNDLFRSHDCILLVVSLMVDESFWTSHVFDSANMLKTFLFVLC